MPAQYSNASKLSLALLSALALSACSGPQGRRSNSEDNRDGQVIAANPDSLRSTVRASVSRPRYYTRESSSAVPIPRARFSKEPGKTIVSESPRRPKLAPKLKINPNSNLSEEEIRRLLVKEKQKPFYEVYSAGRQAYREDKFELAIRLFSKTLRRKPDCAEAYFFRCLSRAKLGKDRIAEVDYDRAVALNGKRYLGRKEYANIYYDRALAKVDERQTARSIIEDWTRAISIRPAYAKRKDLGTKVLARALRSIAEGNDAKAWEDFVILKKLNDFAYSQREFAIRYDQRGMSKYNNEDFVGALEDFRMAIRAYPEFKKAITHSRQVAALINKKSTAPGNQLRIDSDLQALGKAIVTTKTYSAFYDKLTEIRKNIEDLKGQISKKSESESLALLKDVSQKLELSVFDVGMKMARRDQQRRDFSGAWRRSEKLKKVATGPRVRRVTLFQKGIAEDYAISLVAQASSYSRKERSEAREIMNLALEVDPDNEDAIAWLRRHGTDDDASSESDDSSLGSGFYDLFILFGFLALVLGMGYVLFFNGSSKSSEAKPPKAAPPPAPDEV